MLQMPRSAESMAPAVEASKRQVSPRFRPAHLRGLVLAILGVQALALGGGWATAIWLTVQRQDTLAGLSPLLLQLTFGLAGGMILLTTALGACIFARRHELTLRDAQSTLEAEVERNIRESVTARDALIFGLAKLADYRDTDTGSHLERICTYSVILAHQLREVFAEEIDEPWIQRLRVAASLHDIGKVGIPDEILLKPGALTEHQRHVMQRHTLIGADTLIAIRERLGEDELVVMSIEIALSHHERWDGQGYPYGLRGDNIPLSARIVALADVYDALTSARVYKSAMPHEKAAAIIREGRGTQFDPAVVDAFDRAESSFREAHRQLRGEDVEVPPIAAVVELLKNQGEAEHEGEHCPTGIGQHPARAAGASSSSRAA